MPPDNERRPGGGASHEVPGARGHADDQNLTPTPSTIQVDSLVGLLPQHRKLIEGSTILPEVAIARGYRSVKVRAELERLGFSASQRNVPALLVPVYGVNGEVATYQSRPDQPRIGKNGKAIKYETPRGSRMVIDVPPRVRPQMGEPSVSLWITEGARKADAGVSAGLCTIALLGVWNWRGTNEVGGKAALPDWESIALNGREVNLVFDSDVMEKKAVHQALGRLKAFLESRGAKVRVVYLPDGESGAKVGLDDFLAAGGSVEQLHELAQPELRPLPADGEPEPGQYFERGGCTFWRRPMGDGFIDVQLANFTATIVAEIEIDDGFERRREFQIEARLGDAARQVSVPARSFGGLNWVTEALGARAVISPGFSLRDHLRAAIQMRSDDITSEVVYAHSGWREIPDLGWVYLHAGGALGPVGPVAGVNVSLPGALGGMVLPDPPTGEALRNDLIRSLDLLDLGPPQVTFAVVTAVYRAGMGETDFSIHLLGPTGSFKTEVAALGQSSFGAGFTARNLPGSWSSTANSLEVLASIAKDALIVVDDFAPAGSRIEVQRQHREAGRIFRSQGNLAGRARLSADATLKEGRRPRGTILSTGEEEPNMQSARARVFLLEVGSGDINVEALTRCQGLRDEGVFARTMAAFLSWVASSYEDLRKKLSSRARDLRAQAQADDRHKRTAAMVAELQAGFELFLAFAQERGGLPAERVEDLRRRCWAALLETAEDQSRHQITSDPAHLFIRLLGAAITSGVAHVCGQDGTEPACPEALGWRATGSTGFGEHEHPTYRPQGARVGWAVAGDLYLDPDAALKAAQEMASDSERIPGTTQTVSKRLHERGLLLSTDESRGRLLVRRMLGGKRVSVLHLRLGALTGAAQSAQSSQTAPDGASNGGDGPLPWAESQVDAAGTGPVNRPTNGLDAAERGVGGPDGPSGPEAEIDPQATAANAVGGDQGEAPEGLWGLA